MKEYVVGVDLGGTKVEACLLDSDRNIMNRQRVFSEAHLGPDKVIDNILSVIEKVSEGQKYSAVGMGTPGTYIKEADKLFGVPHTPFYETAGFLSRIKEKLNCTFVIENDANCLGIAEYFASCKGKYGFVMAVIIGTGMGYGLVLDEKLYRGANGGAGEIGHTSIDINGRQCECGRKGCAEAYLSGPSISRRYFEMCGEELDTEEIYNRYFSGHRIAIELFDESCEIMGEVFANVVNAFDLEAIILGGGVSNIPLWYEKVPRYLMRSLFGPPRENIPIIKARLGDSAGVVGAGYLALREIGLMNF